MGMGVRESPVKRLDIGGITAGKNIIDFCINYFISNSNAFLYYNVTVQTQAATEEGNEVNEKKDRKQVSSILFFDACHCFFAVVHGISDSECILLQPSELCHQ